MVEINTGQGIEKINCLVDHEKFEPTPHQLKTVEAFLTSPYKGMLLYHQLGAGKTCTSIIIADTMLKEKLIDKVLILTPGSLRDNWASEYCKKCGSDFADKFIFATYNYFNIRNKLNPHFLERALVIIEEVHNFINGVKNGSLNPVAIFKLLDKADCRILALSGTPIYNYVSEFAILGRLLKPKKDDQRIGFISIFDEKNRITTKNFSLQFITKPDGSLMPQNPYSIRKLVEGIISFYPGSTEHMPQILEQEIIKVEMTPRQELAYWHDAIKEERYRKPPAPSLKDQNPQLYLQLKRLQAMAKKYILSRRVSNFYYPKKFFTKKDALTIYGGWVDREEFDNHKLITTYSTKFAAFYANLIKNYNQKHVLFTFFKRKSGVYLIQAMLQLCNITSEIFSGDLDDKQRESVLSRFNSPANRHGENVKILLVTEAGAEGISILEARHMHILESSIRMNRTIQAIGRVARYRSHALLPENERTVKIWRYWSMGSPEPVTVKIKVYNNKGTQETVDVTVTNKETVDQKLYYQGLKNMKSIQTFLDILKDSAVEKLKIK